MMKNPDGFFQQDAGLKSYNTFGIDEKSRFFCRVSKKEELLSGLEFARREELPVLILGGGSNILLTRKFDGLCIRLENTGIRKISESDQQVTISVAAGENWHKFVMHCLDHGWYGLENLSLIPGSVGAAPMQNIGAYGVEAGKFIESILYYHTEKHQWEEISGTECGFGYRDSIFKKELKGKAIIWEVRFRLSLIPELQLGYGDVEKTLVNHGVAMPGPKDVSKAVIEIRRSKLPDPEKLGNAGSFFKNPVIEREHFEKLKHQWPEIPSYPAEEGKVKVPAGWLIEMAGWKGMRRGSCGVHEKQALVIVNYLGATGQDILSLAGDIISDILQKTGIELVPEVNIL